jgi:hypothetical protein
MAINVVNFVTQRLSVGNALQNILFYAMLLFLFCLIIAQLQTKHISSKQRSVAK